MQNHGLGMDICNNVMCDIKQFHNRQLQNLWGEYHQKYPRTYLADLPKSAKKFGILVQKKLYRASVVRARVKALWWDIKKTML